MASASASSRKHRASKAGRVCLARAAGLLAGRADLCLRPGSVMGQIFSGTTPPSYSFKLDFESAEPVASMSPVTGDDIDMKALLARAEDALVQIQDYKVRERTLRMCSSTTCTAAPLLSNPFFKPLDAPHSPRSFPQSCQDTVKKAIEAPKDVQTNTDAAAALKDNITAIKSWYDLAEDLAVVLPQLAANILRQGAITASPELATALAQLVAFMYRFDQAKLYESGIQNDFSG